MKKGILKSLFVSTTIVITSWVGQVNVVNAGSNLLGWNAEQAATWQRMKNENHFLWQHLKAQADSTNIYDDDGLRDAMVYLITGDVAYAQEAYSRIKWYAGRTKPGAEPSSRNTTRQKFGRMAMMYNWFSDVLPAQDKADFRDILEHWADLCLDSQPPWGTRTTDSDETIGHYFGIVIFALALQNEDPVRSAELLNFVPNNNTPAVGGLDATGANGSTMRNAISRFAKAAVGGQWVESSQYNLGTLQLLIAGVEAVNNFMGEDKFPEVTALYPALADSLVQEMTPNFKDSFQWGDVQDSHYLGYYHRNPLMSMLAGLTKDPKASYLIWDKLYYAYYPTVAEGGVFYFADPYAPRQAPSGVTSSLASGRGVALYHSGWNTNDSFFASQMINDNRVDHELESLSNFALFRNGNWALTTPIGYINLDDSPLTNTLMVSGAFGKVTEARGEIASEAGSNYLYHSGTQGGTTYDSRFYYQPDETVHEWTRSSLYLHHTDGSDSIIVFDRVNATDPLSQKQWKIDNYRNKERDRFTLANGRHQWIIHMKDPSPSINGDTITWKTPIDETVTLKSFMTDYTTQFIDEMANRSSGSNPYLGGGFLKDKEYAYQLRLIPNSKSKWQTLSNVIHVGGSFTSSQLIALSGDDARGVTLDVGSERYAVIFNGTEGPYIAPSQRDQFGYTKSDPNKFNDIANSRFFSQGFTMDINTTGLTTVFLADLDPAKEWLMDINGVETTLTVSESGLSQFQLTNVGLNTIRLNFGNEAPTANVATPSVSGFTVSFDGSGSFDPNGDVLSYLWDFGDGNTSTEIAPTHVYSSPGTYTISLTVSDAGLSDSVSVFQSIGINSDPVLSTIGNRSVDSGKQISFTISASDSGDAITLSTVLTNGSQEVSTIGASFVDNGDGTGNFTWVPGPEYVGQSFFFTFKAQDLGGLFDEEMISITVNSNALIFPYTFEGENMPITTTGAARDNGWKIWSNGYIEESFYFAQSGRYVLSIVAKGDFAGPDLPNMDVLLDQVVQVSMDVDSQTYKTYLVEFDISAGVHSLAFAFTNDFNETSGDRNLYIDKATIDITSIQPVNSAPVLDAIVDQSVIEGGSLTVNVTSSDPDGDSLTLSALLLDGSALSTIGASFVDNLDGTGVVSFSPSLGAVGIQTIQMMVSDGFLNATQNVNIDVLPIINTAPVLSVVSDQTVVEGSSLLFNVSSSDIDGDSLVLSAALLDGSALSTIGAAFIDNGDGTGTFSFIPSSINVGTHSIQFMVTDGALTDQMTVNVDVTAKTVFDYIWIESESSNSRVGNFKVSSDSSASVGKYIQLPNGTGSFWRATTAQMVTYDVNIVQAGDYVIHGRVIADTDQDDSFYVQIDNGANNLWDTAPGSAWHWDNVSNRGSGDVKVFLTAGVHTIKVKGREDGTKLDKILLTNDLTFVPSGEGGLAIPPAVINTAPVLSAVVAQSVVEGDSLVFNISSSDVDGDSLSLSASLLDGSALSTIGASFVDNGDGTGAFSFVPSAAQVGTVALKFSVTDGNLSDQITVNVVVTAKTVFDYIWLESEYSDSQTGNFNVEVDGSASLGNYIQMPNGSGSFWSPTTAQMTSYNVNITQAGEYVLYGRVIADNGNDNSFYVQIDSGADNLWDTAQGSAWHWDSVKDRTAGLMKVYLTAGAHTIKVKGREDGTKLDKLLLTNDLGFVPSGEGEGAIIPPVVESQYLYLEAEQTTSINGRFNVSRDSSASGGSFVYMPNGSGSRWSPSTSNMVTYNVNIVQAGEYVLHGKVIAGNDNDNSFYVQIDNGVDNLWDVSLGSGWHWDNVSNRGSGDIRVFLTAGTHTLKVKGREDGTKLDKLLLTDDLSFVPVN